MYMMVIIIHHVITVTVGIVSALGGNQAALPLRSQLLLLKVDALHLSLSSRQRFLPLGLILL